jgi:membrane-bound metal-dependent hydrolase YbcI (DUF457 family)
MRVQGHIAAGYLASQVLAAALSIPAEDRLTMLALGTLAGGLPDLDALYYFAKKKAVMLGDDFRHHHWVSHTFPPYLILTGLLFILGWGTANSCLQNASLFLGASVCMHLLLDMVGSGDGIMILWPFSRRMVGIGKLNAHGMTWKRKYEASPYIWIENTILLAAFLLLSLDIAGII